MQCKILINKDTELLKNFKKKKKRDGGGNLCRSEGTSWRRLNHGRAVKIAQLLLIFF
jgi:hypothetical protein